MVCQGLRLRLLEMRELVESGCEVFAQLEGLLGKGGRGDVERVCQYDERVSWGWKGGRGC